MIVVMVRIPVGSAEEGSRLQERFENRMGAVDNMQGFMGFELLKGEHEYVSVTRWASQADLERWTASQAHAQAHARPSTPTSGGHPQAEAATHEAQGAGRRTDIPASSTLIYEVVIPKGDK
jgi:heme-degrading monooxygenase HmoA